MWLSWQNTLPKMHGTLGSIPSTDQLDAMGHTCNVMPALGRQRQENEEFRVILGYIVNLRLACAT